MMMNAAMIIAGAVLAVGIWAVVVFNRLVRQKNLLKEAWSGIDVQLKRRCDLIPNIVDAVKGYRQHEQETLERVMAMRSRAMAAGPIADRASSENSLSGALKTLFAVAESYPDLKASQNFLALQQSLVEVEDHLQMARRYFNGTARDYNILVQSFPSSLVARAGRFGVEEFFEIETATERQAPAVKF